MLSESGMSQTCHKPHGGRLQNLVGRDAGRHDALVEEAKHLPKLLLTDRQLCDLELILNGGFSPLTGFLDQSDYDAVLSEMRLADGTLWPMPITLDVSSDSIAQIGLQKGARVALLDPRDDRLLAIMTASDVYRPDKTREASMVFGTNDVAHPAVSYLFRNVQEYYVGGAIDAISLPLHYDYAHLRRTPSELRELFAGKNWTKIVAFQTRNPMHRAHLELTLRAARNENANILLHPVVGMTKPGDVDHYTRVRAYDAILSRFPKEVAQLSLLPLAMRMGGPREALWHAIIRKNYGCTHFIVGRDHAGPGKDSLGSDFYGAYDAQSLVARHQEELGIQMVPFMMVSYLPETDEYVPEDELMPDMKTLSISGTEIRRCLKLNLPIPEWFSFPEVVQVLRDAYPPREKQGFFLLITGFHGDQIRALSNALQATLQQQRSRTITMIPPALLDGLTVANKVAEPESGTSVISGLIRAGAIVLAFLPAVHADLINKLLSILPHSGGLFWIKKRAFDNLTKGEPLNTNDIGHCSVLEFDGDQTSTKEMVDSLVTVLAREGFCPSI